MTSSNQVSKFTKTTPTRSFSRSPFLPNEFFSDWDLTGFPTSRWNFLNNWTTPWTAGNDSSLSIYEEGDHLCCEVELPGFQPENIELQYNDGRLYIKAKRQNHCDEGNTNRHYYCKSTREVEYNEYSFTLPCPVSEGTKPKANYKDGILTVTFQKQKAEKGCKIPVSASK